MEVAVAFNPNGWEEKNVSGSNVGATVD